MLNTIHVVDGTRRWIGEVTLDLLNQFDVVLVLDGPGTTDWSATEKNVWLRYYRSGHGIGVLWTQTYSTRANTLLQTLKHVIRPNPSRVSVVTGGQILLKTDPKVAFYDTIESANVFYAKDTTRRWVNGDGIRERPIDSRDDSQGDVFTDFTVGGTNVVAGSTEVQGTYTNLIVWPSLPPPHDTPADESIAHVAFEPAIQSGGPSPYVDGDLPGRLLGESNARNFKTGFADEGHFSNDHLRMLAKACIWLNRDSVPRSVLIYHCVETNNDFSPYDIVRKFYGMARHLEEYMIMVPHVDFGTRLP